MIKSIILFILLFIAIVFWVYVFSNPQQSIELDTKYAEYLSGAIVRNTPSFDVIVDTSVFTSKNIDSPQEFILNLNTSESSDISLHDSQLLSHQAEWAQENLSSKGNFWTPRIENFDGFNSSENCDWWLIYDPCLVLWAPKKANGWMNFWSLRYN